MIVIMIKKPRELIKSYEAKHLKKRPLSIKIADSLTTKFGTLSFLIINAVFFFIWILINTGNVSQIPIFDPFPFIFLTMAVSLEAIFLAVIVLISQNRESQMTKLREEFNLQIDLITEREITKALKLLKEIKEKNETKKAKDVELEKMLEEVDTSYIEKQLEKQLSNDKSLNKELAKPVNNLKKKIKENL